MLHRSRAGGARSDDDGHALADDGHCRLDQCLPLLVVEPVRFAEDAEYRHAVDTKADRELEQTSPRREIETLVVVEGGGQDGDYAGKHGRPLCERAVCGRRATRRSLRPRGVYAFIVTPFFTSQSCAIWAVSRGV